MVNPSRRSQLREVLRAQAHDQRWAALIDRHGTPLLVLTPTGSPHSTACSAVTSAAFGCTMP